MTWLFSREVVSFQFWYIRHLLCDDEYRWRGRFLTDRMKWIAVFSFEVTVQNLQFGCERDRERLVNFGDVILVALFSG